jgi:hypothetical protein
MSSTADIADSATEVQVSLTTAEAELVAQFGTLPPWYLALRDAIHGLINDSAWAVGEADGAAIMGLRCQGRQPHQETCVAYRAALSTTGSDDVSLTTCPQCHEQVHSLFSDMCWECWKANTGWQASNGEA